MCLEMLNCSRCKEIKSTDAFQKDSSRKRGYDYYCKSCRKLLEASNPEIHRQRRKRWVINNREKKQAQNRAYTYRRRKSDVLFKLKHNTACLIRECLKSRGYRKTSKTSQITGLNSLELQTHLVETYKSRYGKYPEITDNVHIDHIIPISSAKTEEEIIKLNHYTNLQLLTAEDNMKKSDTLE